jgi:hypothetical protein
MTVIALFVGMAICFSGYRWFLILLPILGFFFGFGIGAQTVTAIFGGGFLSTVTSWVVGFFVALIFAVLSYLFYFIGVALVGGYLGYSLGVGLLGLIGIDFGLLAWLVGMVLGVIFAIGTIVLNIQKYVIIAFTSLAGAGVIVGSFLFVFGVIQPVDIALNAVGKAIKDSPFWLIIFLVIAILGIAAQLYSNRSYELSPPEDRLSFES